MGINFMKRNTRFKPGTSGNETAKWKPGQSGNPAGKSKRRSEFEDAFTEALITLGGPEEAAQLLWQAARGKEPWAIQELCRRFAPQTQSIRVVDEAENDGFDYSKLTDEQISQLDAIFGSAEVQPGPPGSGKSPSQPA
jgi:hypothetical protein